MKAFRILTILALLAAGLVGGRFLWTKYGLGKEVTIGETVEQTKKDLFSRGEEFGQQLEKVLGESETGRELNSYVRQELPQVVKEEIQKSEIVKQIQEEVTRIVNQSSQTVKELPQNEVKKIKREIKEEICSQLLDQE